MKVVIQRCKNASVIIENMVYNSINDGMVILVGFTNNDGINEINYMVDKIINLRIFDDENHVMNKSIKDINGSILSISQFTLYADTKKGRRPSYIDALNGREASKLYDLFNQKLSENLEVKTGIFGSDMQASLINDGPVTIIMEKEL